MTPLRRPLLTTELPILPLADWLGRAVARGVLTPDAAEVLAGPICPLHNRPIILRDGDHAWCRACMQVELEADE